MSDMSAIDAAWLRMDRPTNLAIITSVLWLARPPAWETVGELLRERLVDRFPRFIQRAVEPRIPIGMPRWEDDPRFDPRRHLRRHGLPAPGDQAALEAFVATLQSTPLDRDKPLWSAQLVDGFGDGGAIVWRIQHCIVDGVSLARVLLSLSDHAPEAGIAPDLKRHTPPLPAVARTSPDTPTVLKGPLSVPQRTTWTTPMSIDDVKQIGRPTGTTVNDVALAAPRRQFCAEVY